MCDDVNATVEQLAAKGVTCGPVSDEGWGLLTSIRLPGGGELGLYEPRHPQGDRAVALLLAQPRLHERLKRLHCSTASAYGRLGEQRRLVGDERAHPAGMQGDERQTGDGAAAGAEDVGRFGAEIVEDRDDVVRAQLGGGVLAGVIDGAAGDAARVIA